MASAATPTKKGLHHLGLTVTELDESARFFTELLGWKEVKRDPDYPAVFVSDGAVTVTLWKNQAEPAVAFDRARSVGLQHAAFAVPSREELAGLHEKLARGGVEIQFPPQPRPNGQGLHFFCFEPSGIRLEFLWPG